MKLKATLIGLLFLGADPLRPLGADLLDEITHPVTGKARRASSGLFDPESNQDAVHLGPGEREVLTELQGPGEIRHMWFTIAGRDRRSPRTLVLRIFWDGAPAPSVETPIGDFFAAGNGMRAEVDSLPIQVTSYGRALNCYWRMPFREKARIEMENQGRHDLCVYWQIDWMELPEAPRDALYFHARYRQEFPVRPFSPYVIFEGEGDGHYVGTVFSIQSSFGSWFGESDDRFYIDGEEEPSIVGTGTEDYFCDAWNLRLFSNANTGVTIKEPNGEDCRFTAYRWHIQAPVTFRKSLRVEIERRSFCQVVDPDTGERKEYDFKYRPDFCSSVAFWYQKGIARVQEPLPPVEKRIDAEVFLEVADMVPEIRASAGVKAERRANRVSNEKRMLLVQNDRVGGWFEIPFKIEEAGKYSISVFQRLFRTEGIWKVTLKGPKGEILLDPAMDFHDPYLAWKENRPENFLYGTWFEKKVGISRLEPGEHAFRFECVGSNPLSRSDGLFRPGLDCGLDGISLRRFPWEDLHGWMERYLAEEEKLFQGRIAEAKGAVRRLEDAIGLFRLDTGEYPRSLAELVERPERLFGSAGRWPYLERLPRDPWGQLYRYEVPGRFHPEGVDVYSVHGNSRSPAMWIGNWADPFRLKGALEGEDLKVLGASRGASAREQEIEIGSVPPLSGGKLLFLRFTGPGEWVDLGLPPKLKEGDYSLTIRYVTSRDYGTIRIQLNGRTLIEGIDAFTPRIGAGMAPCGRVRLASGGNVLRVEAVGRSGRSAGFFAGIDAVLLSGTGR